MRFYSSILLFIILLNGCSETSSDQSTTQSKDSVSTDTMTATITDTVSKNDTLKPWQKPVEDLIVVNTPLTNTKIQSPLTIQGKALGFFYFEGDFPIHLYDDRDSLIATAIAVAQSDWMSEDFVPFRARMDFNKPASASGKLVFERSNASGLPEHDRKLTIPIKFQ